MVISNDRKQKTTFAKNRDLPRSRSRDLTERFIVFIFEAHALQPISRPRGALDTYDRWNMEHADGGKCSKGARMRRSQSPGRAGASTPSPHLLNQSTSELLGPRITQAISAGCTRVRGTLRGAFQRGIDEYFKPSAGLATFGTLFFPWQNCCTD